MHPGRLDSCQLIHGGPGTLCDVRTHCARTLPACKDGRAGGIPTCPMQVGIHHRWKSGNKPATDVSGGEQGGAFSGQAHASDGDAGPAHLQTYAASPDLSPWEARHLPGGHAREPGGSFLDRCRSHQEGFDPSRTDIGPPPVVRGDAGSGGIPPGHLQQAWPALHTGLARVMLPELSNDKHRRIGGHRPSTWGCCG